MKILILGDGSNELAWARWFQDHPEHQVVACYPGFQAQVEQPVSIPKCQDLDAALAVHGVELAVVGGPSEFRMEALRRAAALGLPVICLHPPGPDSEAYYQVALSREETGAIIVPDLPLRLHPAIARAQELIANAAVGSLQGIQLIATTSSSSEDLIHDVFPCVIDSMRAIAGDVDSIWAIGQPSGGASLTRLSVFLEMSSGPRCQVQLEIGEPSEPIRFVYQGELGTIRVSCPLDVDFPSRLEFVRKGGETSVEEVDGWDCREAIFQVLIESLPKRETQSSLLPAPNLDDGIRAMEATEGVVRSLRRERKVALHAQPISEEANFKSIMTSSGCLILLSILFLLPVSLAGRTLGLPWLIYLSYFIPFMLAVFVMLQSLRLVVRRPADGLENQGVESEPQAFFSTQDTKP